MHHRRGLVGLGQAGGLSGRIAAPQEVAELTEPDGLVGERARPRMERDRVELLRHGFDPDLDVPLVGEPRIVQASLQHALVPGPDDTGVAAVRDEGEAGAAEREVALMGLHRGHDHAFRQVEEALVEAPLENERRLDEIHHLLQDPGRVPPLAGRVEALDDQSAPLRRVGLDLCFTQDGLVSRGLRYLDRAGDEAMAVGDAARGDRLRADLDRLCVQLRADPPDRPREAEVELAVPDHGLAGGEASHDLPEPLAERGRRLAAPDVVVANRQLVDAEAEPPGEPFRRLGRLVAFEGDPDPGPSLLLACCVRLEALDEESEPPGPDQHLALAAEGGKPPVAKLSLGPPAERRGKLLAADLKQQRAQGAGVAVRGMPAPRGGRERGRGRCIRPAPSRRSPRAHRAG